MHRIGGGTQEMQLNLVAERHLGVLGANRDLAVVFQVELRQSTHFMERFMAERKGAAPLAEAV